MNIGIIQGRLSPPKEGFQECPYLWKDEFKKASKIGLTHIEWIVTSKSFYDNPIFREDVSQYPIHTICADNLVSHFIDNQMFLMHNLLPICEAAIRNDIRYITIPLLENSSVEKIEILKRFVVSIKPILERYPNLGFSFETELSLEKIPYLLQASDNVYLTYDTGNTTSYGISHNEYISKFATKISNVHIKDRNISGKTVEPMTGATNFAEIFSSLKRKKYSGVYTLQTARSTIEKEEETVTRHMNLMRDIYEEC